MKKIVLFFHQIQYYFRNPQDHKKEILVVVSMAIILIAFIVLFVWLIYSLFKSYKIRKKFGKPKKKPKSKAFRIASLITLGSILLILLAALGIGANFTSKPSFCLKCHEMKPYVESWKDSSHRQVNCLACHQEPGIFGFTILRLKALDNLLSSVYKQKNISPETISSRTCLSCHSQINEKTTAFNNIKVSHKEMTNDFSCQECHSQVAHKSEDTTGFSIMAKCLGCHTKESSNCSFCHQKDFAYKPKHREFEKVDLSNISCENCHTRQQLKKWYPNAKIQ